MFKPLIPIIGDVLEHSFNEAIHISIVHAVYGNNHLGKEVAATSENDTKNQTSVKYEEQVPVHLSTKECSFICCIKTNSKPSSYFTLCKLVSVFLSQPLPPPKFS